MNKGIKFRIYPNKEQQNLINRTLGCVRFLYGKDATVSEARISWF